MFVVYSCGQSWLDTYKLSYLRLKDPDADLLDRKAGLKVINLYLKVPIKYLG